MEAALAERPSAGCRRPGDRCADQSRLRASLGGITALARHADELRGERHRREHRRRFQRRLLGRPHRFTGRARGDAMIEPATLSEAGSQVLARSSTEGITLLKPSGENEGHRGLMVGPWIIGGSLGMGRRRRAVRHGLLARRRGTCATRGTARIVGTAANYEPAYMTARWTTTKPAASRAARRARSRG